MVINTKLFGEITVDEEKIIFFESGIIGFPDMKNFLLIHDEEKDKSNIKWLQSIEEPGFALPVMEPFVVKSEYNPTVNDEYLSPLGEFVPEDMVLLVTVTIPTEVEKMTANLKAPIIINVKNQKACQLIVEDSEYIVKYPIYKILKERSAKAGE